MQAQPSLSVGRLVCEGESERETSFAPCAVGNRGIWGFCDRKQIATRAILISEEEESRERGDGGGR